MEGQLTRIEDVSRQSQNFNTPSEAAPRDLLSLSCFSARAYFAEETIFIEPVTLAMFLTDLRRSSTNFVCFKKNQEKGIIPQNVSINGNKL